MECFRPLLLLFLPFLQVQGDKASKGTDIRAHKAVLAARSPFFQRLFMSDMSESRTSTVSVDFSAAVMEHVLRWVFHGQGLAHGLLASE